LIAGRRVQDLRRDPALLTDRRWSLAHEASGARDRRLVSFVVPLISFAALVPVELAATAVIAPGLKGTR
jgi:hypothetical protein